MAKVFMLYKTDVWHSYSSRDLLAVCTTVPKVMSIIKKQVKKEGTKLEVDQVYNLLHIKQTQGYIGEGEFVYEEMETNVLLG